MRFGVKRFESDKGTPDVPQAGGRVILHMPFDERWRDAVERQAAISRDGDLPMQRPTAHGFNIAQGMRGRSHRGADIVGSTDPCRQSRPQIREFLIELEPARSIGAGGIGINRKYFQIEGIAKPEQAIVSPHARMLTAGLRGNSQGVADVLHAGRQRGRRDDYVVNM